MGDQFVSSAAEWIIFLIYALFPHQSLEETGRLSNHRAFCRNESRAPKTRVPSLIAVTMQTVGDDTALMNTTTPALHEQMTLRVAESTSKHFVDRLKPATPVNVNLLESMPVDHPDRDFVVGLCSGLREGFKIGYQGPRQPYVSNI